MALTEEFLLLILITHTYSVFYLAIDQQKLLTQDVNKFLRSVGLHSTVKMRNYLRFRSMFPKDH